MNRTGTVYETGVISAEVNQVPTSTHASGPVDTHQKMYGVGAQSDGALRDLEYLLDFIEAKEDDNPFKDIKIFAGVSEARAKESVARWRRTV